MGIVHSQSDLGCALNKKRRVGGRFWLRYRHTDHDARKADGELRDLEMSACDGGPATGGMLRKSHAGASWGQQVDIRPEAAAEYRHTARSGCSQGGCPRP